MRQQGPLLRLGELPVETDRFFHTESECLAGSESNNPDWANKVADAIPQSLSDAAQHFC